MSSLCNNSLCSSHSERKLVTDPDPEGVGQFSPGAWYWRAAYVHLLVHNPNYIHCNTTELTWLILLTDGQNIRKILTNNSEFSCVLLPCNDFLGWILWCKKCERAVGVNTGCLWLGSYLSCPSWWWCCPSGVRCFASEDDIEVDCSLPVVEDSKA